MSFSLSNRALLRGMLAGAVVLTGTACSRSDRTESGRDNSAAVLPDKDGAGYRSMERDTTSTTATSDSATVEMSASSTDTTASTDVSADTTAAGVALNTTIDTSSEASADVSAETGVAAADTADTTGNTGRIRPPEDSTEILGNITTTDEAADETADEQVVRPEDRETVAASETRTDEVGAAAVGGNVTGAEAVALMSREGVRCAVVDPEASEAVRWDMSNTPITLNPCGMGSMILSRIWTAGSGGQE